MGASLRALRALVLLAGFYLLGVFLLAALGGIDYAVVTTLHGPIVAKLLLASVVLTVPIVRGMFMLRTPKGEPLAASPSPRRRSPSCGRSYATSRSRSAPAPPTRSC